MAGRSGHRAQRVVGASERRGERWPPNERAAGRLCLPHSGGGGAGLYGIASAGRSPSLQPASSPLGVQSSSRLLGFPGSSQKPWSFGSRSPSPSLLSFLPPPLRAECAPAARCCRPFGRDPPNGLRRRLRLRKAEWGGRAGTGISSTPRECLSHLGSAWRPTAAHSPASVPRPSPVRSQRD